VVAFLDILGLSVPWNWWGLQGVEFRSGFARASACFRLVVCLRISLHLSSGINFCHSSARSPSALLLVVAEGFMNIISGRYFPGLPFSAPVR